MWNLVFSNQHGGSILIDARNGSDRTNALSTTTNIGQRRIATHRRRVAMLGRNLLERLRGRPRPNFKSITRVTLGRCWTKTHRREHV